MVNSILPKNEQKLSAPVGYLGKKLTFQVRFLGELKTLKFPFEINWPLISFDFLKLRFYYLASEKPLLFRCFERNLCSKRTLSKKVEELSVLWAIERLRENVMQCSDNGYFKKMYFSGCIKPWNAVGLSELFKTFIKHGICILSTYQKKKIIIEKLSPNCDQQTSIFFISL